MDGSIMFIVCRCDSLGADRSVHGERLDKLVAFFFHEADGNGQRLWRACSCSVVKTASLLILQVLG